MGIGAAIVGLIAWLGDGLIAVLATRVLYFLAIKVFFTALFAVLLPVVINNILQGFISDSFTALNAAQMIDGVNGTITLSGFMGWLADCFQLSACFSLLISAFSFHLFLKIMPFSPVK